MLIKAGVDISRLKPEIRKKLSGIETIILSRDSEEMVITSTYEGDHGAGSLHYANMAVDIRKLKKVVYAAADIKQWLGKDYDVVVEGNHYHIEYDPKG